MLAKKSKNYRLLLFLCLSFYQLDCIAQSEESSPQISKKNAISFNIAGTTPFVGVTYERLLSNRFNFEVGLGAYSVGVGIKYFPSPIIDNKMVFHIAIGTNVFVTPFDTFGSGDSSSINYLSVGLTYFGKGGFNFGIGVGYSLNYDFTFDELTGAPYGNLKLGYRF